MSIKSNFMASASAVPLAERDPVMPVAKAAAYIGYSESTLNKLRCTGGGPKFIKRTKGKGGRVLYRLADLDAWLASMTYASTSQVGEVA